MGCVNIKLLPLITRVKRWQAPRVSWQLWLPSDSCNENTFRSWTNRKVEIPEKIDVEIKGVMGTQSGEFDLCESKRIWLGNWMGKERRTAYTRNLVKEVKHDLEHSIYIISQSQTMSVTQNKKTICKSIWIQKLGDLRLRLSKMFDLQMGINLRHIHPRMT